MPQTDDPAAEFAFSADRQLQEPSGMNLKQIGAWGQSQRSGALESAPPNVDRYLTLLADGAAAGVPEIDAAVYRGFRAQVDALTRQLPDRLPDDQKLALIRSILQEFESYRNKSEASVREQVIAWRGVVSLLFEELLANLGMDHRSADAASLVQPLKQLTTGKEVDNWRQKLNLFLHPLEGQGPAERVAAQLRVADCTTANDNAAGLRGGGSAVEHLRKIMNAGGDGYIVLFRLSCLDVISQRFGPEAVEDCLMAVSAFLTAGLEGKDTIYHWSDSALLAILQGRYSEMMVSAELDRIIARNRESNIVVAGRAIMLRIPINFELTPISRLRSADDLLKISAQKTAKR